MIKQKRNRCKNSTNGFTMIELMVTLAIVAALMGYGLPAYYDFSVRQKLTSLTNELLGDLNYTRTQAINQGTKVSITAISGNNNWSTGWTIDKTLPDGTTQQLRLKQMIDSDPAYVISGTPAFIYNSLGSATTSGSLTIEKNSEYPGYLTLTVTPSGMASSSRTL